jgi:AcrR family transcriptional regulator
MPRTYTLKKRAALKDETRQRIIDAAVDLHVSLGPARTTVKAIAARARIQRLTFYRHFPSERELLWACSRHYLALNPLPLPGPWLTVADPRVRLRKALRELFRYYGRTENRWILIGRDRLLRPDLAEFSAPYAERWAEMRAALEGGWKTPAAGKRLLSAALGHALDFRTWSSLVRQQGLSAGQAVSLLEALVVRAAGGRVSTRGSGAPAARSPTD